MTRNRRHGLWTPVLAGFGGSAISLAIGFGHGKWEAIVIGEVVTAVAVVVLYFASAQDSDVGAVLGHRADERQVLVRLKASRVSAVVGVLAAIVACVIAGSIDTTYWPFEVIYIVMGASYLIGLGIYGAASEGDGAVTGNEADHVDP
jgi:hypothetical protein